jgi:hypothetical protein
MKRAEAATVRERRLDARAAAVETDLAALRARVDELARALAARQPTDA